MMVLAAAWRNQEMEQEGVHCLAKVNDLLGSLAVRPVDRLQRRLQSAVSGCWFVSQGRDVCGWFG